MDHFAYLAGNRVIDAVKSRIEIGVSQLKHLWTILVTVKNAQAARSIPSCITTL